MIVKFCFSSGWNYAIMNISTWWRWTSRNKERKVWERQSQILTAKYFCLVWLENIKWIYWIYYLLQQSNKFWLKLTRSYLGGQIVINEFHIRRACDSIWCNLSKNVHLCGFGMKPLKTIWRWHFETLPNEEKHQLHIIFNHRSLNYYKLNVQHLKCKYQIVHLGYSRPESSTADSHPTANWLVTKSIQSSFVMYCNCSQNEMPWKLDAHSTWVYLCICFYNYTNVSFAGHIRMRSVNKREREQQHA